MPNHFHAIIIIGDNVYNTKLDANGRDAMHRVSTNKHGINKPQNKYGRQSKNLAPVIGGF